MVRWSLQDLRAFNEVSRYSRLLRPSFLLLEDRARYCLLCTIHRFIVTHFLFVNRTDCSLLNESRSSAGLTAFPEWRRRHSHDQGAEFDNGWTGAHFAPRNFSDSFGTVNR